MQKEYFLSLLLLLQTLHYITYITYITTTFGSPIGYLCNFK